MITLERLRRFQNKPFHKKIEAAQATLRRLGLKRPDLKVPACLFDACSPHMKSIGKSAASIRFYRRREAASIDGFLTPRERQMLYALACVTNGTVSEIGSWCGLSTTAIAQGVRDSHVPGRQFHTYDLRVSETDFRPVQNGIGFFPLNSEAPLGVCSEDSYVTQILPVLKREGSVNGELLRNLEKLQLREFVTVHVGDFRTFPPIPSDMVFCDALHNSAEIAANALALRPFLQNRSILACHDIGQSRELIRELHNVVPLSKGACIDSLYVAEVLL